MKIKSLWLSFLVSLFVLGCFAGQAWAQSKDQGFDGRVGLSGDIAMMTYKDRFDTGREKDSLGGVVGNLSFGYRWKYVGVFIEQDLGGVIMGKTGPVYKDGDSWFLGGTYFMARGFYGFENNMQVELSAGLGAIYSSGDKMKFEVDPDHKFPLIYNDDLDPSGAFALRFGVGYTYYINELIGIGVHFNYTIGFKHHNYKRENYDVKNPAMNISASFNHEYTSFIHNMDPGVHASIRF